MLNQSLVTNAITRFFEEYPLDEELLVLMRNTGYPVIYVQTEIIDWDADLLPSVEKDTYPIEIKGDLAYRALEAEGSSPFQEKATDNFLSKQPLPTPESPDSFAEESEGKAHFTLSVHMVLNGNEAAIEEPVLTVEGFGLYDKELAAFDEEEQLEHDFIQQIIVGRPEDQHDIMIESIPLLALFEDYFIEQFDIENIDQLETFLEGEVLHLQQTLSNITNQSISWDESQDSAMYSWELEGSFWRYMKAVIAWLRSGRTLPDWLQEEDLYDPSTKDIAQQTSEPFAQLSQLFHEGFVTYVPNAKQLLHQTNLTAFQGQDPQMALTVGALDDLLIELEELLNHFGLTAGEVLHSEDIYDEDLFDAETEREAIFICAKVACVSLFRAADYSRTHKLPLVIHEQILL